MKLATGLKLLWRLAAVLFTVLLAYRGATWRMLIKRCNALTFICILDRLAYCEIIL